MKNEPCQFLKWDSDFFGRRVARVNASVLDEKKLMEINLWCRENSIDCLYFLADMIDKGTVTTAEIGRFHLVDIRVTMEKEIETPVVKTKNTSMILRPAIPNDVPLLRKIAAKNHRFSRFYYDGNFPVELCDKFYETWIENSCNNFADAVIVADVDGFPAGYITCSLTNQTGQIGLLGIEPSFQGKGIGNALLNGSLRWFTGQGVKKTVVVTQGRNISAQRLYQKNGFITADIKLWYHKWFTGKS